MKPPLIELRKALSGLQLRTTLLLMAVVLAATLLTGLLYGRIASRITLEEAMRNARSLAKAVAASTGRQVTEADRDALLDIAVKTVNDGELTYLVFADMSGRIIQGYQRGQGQMTSLLLEQGEEVMIEPIDRPTLAGDAKTGPRIDVVFPVTVTGAARAAPSATVGYVRLGLDLAAAQRRLAAVRTQVAGLAAAITLLMVPVGFEVVRRLATPINRLAEAALRMARGDLGVRVEAKRGDEIGDLARAFNGMAAELSKSHNQLVKLNAELEDRVLRRTEALESANRQLRGEIEEKQDFIRTISHDLSAPLRNVSGMASMLRTKEAGRLGEEGNRYLDRIEHNVRQELELIDDLLELSQIQSGEGVATEVDLQAEIEALAKKLEFELSAKNIRVSIEGELPTLHCDRLRIRQLFQNLIDNAAKYTDPAREDRPRPPAIRISCEDLGDLYQFRVADNGIGVSAEDGQRIFHVFRRATNTFVRGVSGRGVGLSCCKSIVQRLGGTIWVEPNSEGGSVFRFTMSKAIVGGGSAAALTRVGTALAGSAG